MTSHRHADDGNPQAKRTIVRRVEATLAKLFKPAANAYHPEQHYLRGRPGPKAQAKRHDDDVT